MRFRAMLRVGALLLLLRTWLADSDKPSPAPNFKFSRVPEDFLDIFNCKNCANQSTVQKILDRVLSNYDMRLRPNFGGGPVIVKIAIYVTSIQKISDTNMNYTITIYFYQTWKDSRLAYYETNLNLTLDYLMNEKLWVPSCYFLNTKDVFIQDATVDDCRFQLHPDGTVRYGTRLTTTTACSLNLHKFPMEEQTCKLEVESFGYTAEDIILSWDNDENGVQVTEDLQIPEFNFVGKMITSKEVYFHTGSHMRLVMKFQVKRDMNSYLLHFFWPTILTTILSWISFWMSHDSSAARVIIGLISILILTTIDSHLRDRLPHIAYVKAIDIYILVCLFFMFLSLIEYIYINYLYFSQGPRRQRRRHRRPRRAVARYLYHDAVVRHAQDDLINVENEVGSGSLPTHPAQAPLASPESLGSLATISEQAPLATSESLSTFSSTSSLAQLDPGENLSHLPSTSQQPLPGFNDMIVPTHTEAHVCVEIYSDSEDDSEDNLGLDESHGRGPRGRPMLSHGQRCVQEAGLGLQDDISIKSSSLDLEEQRDSDSDSDSIRSVDEENPTTSDQEDSSSESEDDCLLSCGHKEGSSKLFSPKHVRKIDWWCQVLLSLSFGLLSIGYWLYHLF
ncbi:gamma-aminobutyric acid receptor subunit theta [Octodon degus]|uniref:Gamma-aminobutyric acid receptor subunit beta n=1 Tax=Octodon degus TaxID=10160 RepID=A0A6P3FG43_OCTDE|nr:gamma-aminobutyric acid receptor subunit theta [Octodon degus]